MKLIFILVGMLINKFTVFGIWKTHMRFYRGQCIYYLWSRGIIGLYFFENEDSAAILA